MKSKALAVVRLPERYKKDLPVIERISADQLNRAAQWVKAIDARPESEQTESDMFDLATSTGLPAERLYPAINTLRYTRDLLSRYGDSAEAVLGDLVELQLISSPAAEKLQAAVAQLPPRPAEVLDYWRAYGVVLPVYEYAISRCLLLPAFDDEYSPETDPAKYKPRVETIIPAVVFNIVVNAAGTSDDQRDQFSFVMGESAIDDLVKRLQLAKTQLTVFKDTLKV
jgi:hypothetical protein